MSPGSSSKRRKVAVIGCELAFSRRRKQDSLALDLGEVGVLATLSSETSALGGGRTGEVCNPPRGKWGEADMALTGAQ